MNALEKRIKKKLKNGKNKNFEERKLIFIRFVKKCKHFPKSDVKFLISLAVHHHVSVFTNSVPRPGFWKKYFLYSNDRLQFNLVLKGMETRMPFIFLFLLFVFMGLTGCAHNPFSSTYTGDSSSAFSSYDDPDGDGDIRGAGHFPSTRKATGKKVFIFDPNYNAWAAYDANGNRLNTGRASGGKLYCPDVNRGCRTIVGNFRVINKKGSDCVSSKFPLETNGGAPMPYCMHFSPKGYAIHGSYDVPTYNASHGCIRVTPDAARWLNQDFVTMGTSVVVLPYSS